MMEDEEEPRRAVEIALETSNEFVGLHVAEATFPTFTLFPIKTHNLDKKREKKKKEKREITM